MRQRSLSSFVLAAIGFSVALFLLASFIPSIGGPRSDNGWSQPEGFPASAFPHVGLLNNTPVCVDQGNYYFFKDNGTGWSKRSFEPDSAFTRDAPYADIKNAMVVLRDSVGVRGGQFEAHVACWSFEKEGDLGLVFDKKLTFSETEFLGGNPTPTCDPIIPPGWRSLGPPQLFLDEGTLGGSMVLENEVYVAYSVVFSERYGSSIVSPTGPNQSGLLCGSANGSTWTKLKLLDFDTEWPDVFATRSNVYFLAGVGCGLERGLLKGLRSVRSARMPNAEPFVEMIAPHFRRGSDKYAAVTGRRYPCGVVGRTT